MSFAFCLLDTHPLPSSLHLVHMTRCHIFVLHRVTAAVQSLRQNPSQTTPLRMRNNTSYLVEMAENIKKKTMPQLTSLAASADDDAADDARFLAFFRRRCTVQERFHQTCYPLQETGLHRSS